MKTCTNPYNIRQDLISIIMPAKNAASFIREAIDSILWQSYDNFELIIVDNGSTDNTKSIINSFSDTRIKLFDCDGELPAALNYGIQLSNGKYIARIDADDIMVPDRLRIQYSLLEDNPSIDICCSSFYKLVGSHIKRVKTSPSGIIKHPLVMLLHSNCISHPTVFMRKDFLYRNELRYQNYIHAEDYKLWVEAAKKSATFFFESQPLIYYRIHDKQISSIAQQEQMRTALRIRFEILDFLLPDMSIELQSLLKECKVLSSKDIIKDDDILTLFYQILLHDIEKKSGTCEIY